MFTLTGLREYFYGFHPSHAALYFLPWMVAFDRCNKYLNIMIHSSSSSKASLNHKLELHPSSISGISVKSPFDKVISHIQNLLLVFDSSEPSFAQLLATFGKPGGREGPV
jgi:hypothetical protein